MLKFWTFTFVNKTSEKSIRKKISAKKVKNFMKIILIVSRTFCEIGEKKLLLLSSHIENENKAENLSKPLKVIILGSRIFDHINYIRSTSKDFEKPSITTKLDYL